jgi:hypothetical protein
MFLVLPIGATILNFYITYSIACDIQLSILHFSSPFGLGGTCIEVSNNFNFLPHLEVG